MGIYVNSGRNVRAVDLINGVDWFLVLGRCTFQNIEFQWPIEATPPAEDLTADWADSDMEAPADHAVGIIRAAEVSLIEQNAGGPISFNGLQWAKTSSAAATHVYWKFVIEPDYFVGDTVGDDILAFRRLSLRANIRPVAGVDPSGPFRAFQALDLGTLFFYSNQTVINRAPSERDIIKIILPQ